jgi:hypothetical protein
MKCILQSCTSICEYVLDVELHAMSVCYSDVYEVKPVCCERDLVTWTLPFVSFNPTTKKNGREGLRVFEVRVEASGTKRNGASGQNFVDMNFLPFVSVIDYPLIYL